MSCVGHLIHKFSGLAKIWLSESGQAQHYHKKGELADENADGVVCQFCRGPWKKSALSKQPVEPLEGGYDVVILSDQGRGPCMLKCKTVLRHNPS